MALSQDPHVLPIDENARLIRDTFELAPPADAICFYCVQPVAHPCIYWHAADRIWLHPSCAASLSRGLMNDVSVFIDLMLIKERAR